MRPSPLWLLLPSIVLSACPLTSKHPPAPMTAGEHDRWFPISSGAVHALDRQTSDGVISCESCHRSEVMKEVTCVGCHAHPLEPVDGHDINESLHLGAPDFRARVPAGADPLAQSQGCFFCHPAGRRLLTPFPHAGIPTGQGTWCKVCHDVDQTFAALPVSGFAHADVGATDCGACHTTESWKGASSVPSNKYDPATDVAVDALTPAWSGPSIVSVALNPQTLHMTMNHGTSALDASLLSNCALCHAQASLGSYAPGVMHWSLTTIGAPQPSRCADCHASTPEGFVGRLDSRRAPSTGPMRHDAVLWANGAPTATRLVATDCSVCHRAPDDQLAASFTTGKDDGGVRLHDSLRAAGVAQPGSCLDCHANSRPTGTVTTATRSFDHSTALGDCQACHASTSTWTGGKVHTTTSPTPATCLPCHESARPVSAAGWVGPYASSPFDYGTNAAGITHGDGLDCAQCHAGPGTGAWGVNANWRSGHFDHGPTSVAATTCITCHSTQRPDLLSPPADPGFDHAVNGASDCIGCHQATVARGSYASLTPIPGGDWRDGTTYPGSIAVTSATQFVRIPSTALARSGGKVTGMTTTTVTLPNSFLHTSAAIPSAVSPGPAGTPNQSSCWHCHTATGTSVTAFADGKFHTALAAFRSTPAAAVAQLPQPAACLDCHRSMRPPNIVSKLDGGAWVQPMDHATTFTGGSVAGVAAMDCGACHKTPGLGPTGWSDGVFHANVPAGAAPADCVSCHYPLNVTSAADVASGSPTAMKHRSGLVTTQACATCHTGALAKSTTSPAAVSLWRPGAYHSSLGTAQPATCLECHATSAPAAATQSTATYSLPQGGTATNGGQWMNHADPPTAAKDCATCHASDAKSSGSAWSRSSTYHAQVPTPGTCARCHGLTNGKGTTPGTNNNLPAGLVDSATVTTSSAAAAGTHDQLSHADVNVSGKDCGACHTQKGPSIVAGVQGKEWAQAAFHQNFTTASPLVMNGTTGRCSTCHLNVKPGGAYTAFDHSAFSGSSAQDCSSCHAFPGTSATAPNWKGASGVAHSSSGSTTTSALDCGTCHGPTGTASERLSGAVSSHFGGVANGNRCTSCHIDFSAFSGTTAVLKYGHTNATANAGSCKTCHAFSSSLYTTLTSTPKLSYPTASGARTFSQTYSVKGSFSGDSFTDTHAGSKLTLCGSCHQYSSTTASTNIWSFVHRPNNPGVSNSKSTNGCNECH